MKTIDKSIYIPYGIEIEMESVDFLRGKRIISHKIDKNWKIGVDKSLKGDGLELTSPILDNNKETLQRLKKISKTLQFLIPSFESSSFQINLSADSLNQDDFVYLLKIFSLYENIIYRYSCGIDGILRDCISLYSAPIERLFSEKYFMNANVIDSYFRFINSKAYGLSLKTLTDNNRDPIKVIEFRTPNGTVDFNLWMNYIVFFSSLLTTIIDKKYDAEYIDYIFLGMNFFQSMEEMLKVDEKRAKELADLIFNCEEEKDIFYSQYFDKIVRTRK